jgi:hypothetical protein
MQMNRVKQIIKFLITRLEQRLFFFYFSSTGLNMPVVVQNQEALQATSQVGLVKAVVE